MRRAWKVVGTAAAVTGVAAGVIGSELVTFGNGGRPNDNSLLGVYFHPGVLPFVDGSYQVAIPYATPDEDTAILAKLAGPAGLNCPKPENRTPMQSAGAPAPVSPAEATTYPCIDFSKASVRTVEGLGWIAIPVVVHDESGLPPVDAASTFSKLPPDRCEELNTGFIGLAKGAIQQADPLAYTNSGKEYLLQVYYGGGPTVPNPCNSPDPVAVLQANSNVK